LDHRYQIIATANSLMLHFRKLLVAFLFFTTTYVLNAQTDFLIHRSWNFEKDSIGKYTDEQIARDFKCVKLYNHNGTDIVPDRINNIPTRVMRITHPANTLSVGIELIIDLEKDFNEVYLSYNWKFSDEFNSTAGGKMPGLGGLPDFSSDCPYEGYGFRAHNLFKHAGRIASYHYDRTESSCPWGTDEDSVYMANGTWYNITQRLVLNTFTNGVANADGIKEVWINGSLVIRETNLKLMEDQRDDMKIDVFRLSNFYGGAESIYIPKTESYTYIDNIKVYTPVGDATYGKQIRHSGNKIRTPDEITDKSFYYDRKITQPGLLSNREYGNTYSSCIDEAYLIDAGENKIVNFKASWDLGAGDYLFVYDGNTTDSKMIKMVLGRAGNQILKSTGRYMFIRFSSDTDPGKTGWSGQVNFVDKNLLVPVDPTSLRATSFTDHEVSLQWNDNSDNESGFFIKRTSLGGGSDTVFLVPENVTTYTDQNLIPSTNYVYSVLAMNFAGTSKATNSVNASTLSSAEMKRTREGLLAYYNFNYSPDHIIHDLSGYGDPLNLKISNESAASWPDGQKLSITQGTLIQSLTPAAKIIRAINETKEISVECWFKPSEVLLFPTSRIISLGNDNSNLAFTLDQHYGESNHEALLNYTTRTQISSEDMNGFPELITNRNLSYINLVHIVYTLNQSGEEKLFVNGEMEAKGTREAAFDWPETYFLKLANEKDLSFPFVGELYGAAIYDKALSEKEVHTNYSAGAKDSLIASGNDYAISIYPNPTDDEVNIEIHPTTVNDLVEATILRITNMYGVTLVQQEIFKPNSSVSLNFHFKNMPRGLYLVHVLSGNRINSAKLILN
jgi:hypothetical protein